MFASEVFAPENTGRILAVEDESARRQRYLQLLSQVRHTVQVVSSVEEALYLLQYQTVDLLLVDLCLPEMDRIGFRRALRHQKHPPEVLVVTGYATAENIVEVMKFGVCGVIPKSCVPKELLAQIDWSDLLGACPSNRLVGEAESLRPRARRAKEAH